MNKKLAIVLGASLASLALANNNANQWYANIGAGMAKVAYTGGGIHNKAGFTANLNVGYLFANRYGVELGAGLLPKAGESNLGATNNRYYDMAFLYNSSFANNWVALGKLGLAYVQTKLNNVTTSSGKTGKLDGIGMLVGAGVGYQINQQWQTNMMFQVITKSSDVAGNYGATVGLTYKF